MRKLSIDIETYSSVDLFSAGSYRYFESIDFEVLLVAYAFDAEVVQIVDLARGESLPAQFVEALLDPLVEKHAYNANFERVAFAQLGYPTGLGAWRCTMIKAAYCGLPLSLAKAGAALGLEDKAKSATGKALIRYFAMPCRPTKKNKGRRRNMPEHDLEKWEDFKNYCKQDVEAEREIANKLGPYALPADEHKIYCLDQKINDRGVYTDAAFAKKAYDIDRQRANILLTKLRDLTAVDNPNSVAQLKSWISNAMQKNIDSLAKSEIDKLIAEAAQGSTVAEVLRLRKRISRTSVKKYAAMLNCVSRKDSRVRGLFQFYGANRTGRWAGRLVQLQNLPRNYVEDLANVRAVFKDCDYEDITMLYDNVSGLLSQLIRTSFIAPKGKVLGVADFSAIEARVIAWLAGERWRLDVFEGHGKIYEASASMMFGVPIEEIGKGSDLRMRGKVAELALGYQGSVGALRVMGGEKMGLSENDMQLIVKRWRKANTKIVTFWGEVELLAKKAIAHKKKVQVEHKQTGLVFEADEEYLTICLPSGRKLFYRRPRLKAGKFGRTVIGYEGKNQVTQKWSIIETYGGKLVENIVQAVARDLLAYAMLALDREGFYIVAHVHDEVIVELSSEGAQASLSKMCRVMSEPVLWAAGLPLAADGFVSDFYKKD